MHDLLGDPDNFSKHLSTYTTSIAMTIIYGLRNSEDSADAQVVADLKDVSLPIK